MAAELPCKIENNILIGEEDPIDDSGINTGELILNAFKSRPDFIGQVDAMTGEENTFQQMRERSVKCALWLKKLGIKRNDIIVQYTSNHLDTYIPFLATLYIGTVLHVWKINKLINVRNYLQAHPKIIFTDVDKALSILKLTKIMNISTTIVVFLKENEESKHKEEEKFESLKFILNNNFNQSEIDEFSCTNLESSKDTAVMLLSAGTTSVIPQHVPIPHAFFTAPSNLQIPVMLSNDVGLWVESLHWNISLLLTVRAILSYVKAVKINISINSKNLISDLDMKFFWNTIQKCKVNWVFLKNSMTRSMTSRFVNFKIFEEYDLSCLKQIIIGGRQLRHGFYMNLADKLPNVSLSKVYCLPEAGVIAYQSETVKDRTRGYVSKNVSLMFVDPTGSPVRAYEIGVVRLKSPSLINGYLNRLGGTLETVTDNNGWFHTDDVGAYTPIGKIYIYERHRSLIIYKNYNILPASIENELLKHPKIKDACVIPMYDRIDGHHPFAFVQKKDSKLTEKEVMEYVASTLPDHMKLRAGVLIKYEDLPYLPNGMPNMRTLTIQATAHMKNNILNEKKKNLTL